MARDRIKEVMALIFGGASPSKVRESVAAKRAEIASENQQLREQDNMLRALAEHIPLEGNTISKAVIPAVQDDGLVSTERSKYVREMALELVKMGRFELSSNDVISALAEKGVVFSIGKAASMVGSVLKGMKEFERVSRNQFHYRGNGFLPDVSLSIQPSGAENEE